MKLKIESKNIKKVPKTFNNIAQEGLSAVVNYINGLITDDLNVIELYGDLGSGKTTLAKQLVNKITASTQNVVSPTFNLVQVYDGSGKKVWHYDLYRLESEQELHELGLEEALDDIVIIEWPQIAHNYLPQRTISVNIEFTKNNFSRNITINL